MEPGLPPASSTDVWHRCGVDPRCHVRRRRPPGSLTQASAALLFLVWGALATAAHGDSGRPEVPDFPDEIREDASARCFSSEASETEPGPWDEEPVPLMQQQPRGSPSPAGFGQLSHDVRYLLRRPTELDRRDKIHLATGAGTWAGLFVLRRDIRDFVQEHRRAEWDRPLDDARLMSRGAFAPGLALAAYLASFVTQDAREKETALMLLESAAFSAIFAAGGSFVLATERPEEGDAIRFFDTEGRGVSVDSALAASIVEPLRCQYLRVHPTDRRGKRFWKRFGSVALYAAASLTALQRVVDDKHWAPDVYLGMAGSLGIGRTLCEAHGKRPRRKAVGSSDTELTYRPLAVADGVGISVLVQFGGRAGLPRTRER